ncbi:putative acetyltransferase [Rubripirellula amarantea]|uniref:Putative acetyltransferase n=1 Tax=Rubripirellula amarantea TaxID=2527999 RepID=A0A5C5WJ34_9BACT|nr:GNAT family N-acetyltransferase [Rubripirellula amarantea]TWT50844.1 putative acetyltransferase [Rubripirellula amarantea]
MTTLRFRPARPDEANELTRIATASKRTWGYDEEQMSLWIPGFTFTPDNIATRTVSVAQISGDTVAVSSLCIADTQCQLDEFWVHPSSIGTGIGRQLLEYTLALASRAGFDFVTVVSDPNAEGFYLRFGGTRIGLRESLPKGRNLPVLKVPTQPNLA